MNISNSKLPTQAESRWDNRLVGYSVAAAERRWAAEWDLASLLPSHPDNASAAVDAGITAGCFDRIDLAIIFAGAVVAWDYTPRAVMLAMAKELRRQHLWTDHPGKSPIDDGPVWWREKLLWAFRPYTPMPSAVRESARKLMAILDALDAARAAHAECTKIMADLAAPGRLIFAAHVAPRRLAFTIRRMGEVAA